MSASEAPSPSPAPSAEPLRNRAGEDLRFIRQAMERGVAFTAVPGWGGFVMGVTALGAAIVAAVQPSSPRWLAVWLIEAALACGLGLWAMHRKAYRSGTPLLRGAGRRFALNFLPPALAAAVLTAALAIRGDFALLPGLWLLLYGVAVVTGGAFSVRPVPVMGLAFMTLGAICLMVPPTWGDLLLGIGFGGLHMAFGVHIGRYHGG